MARARVYRDGIHTEEKGSVVELHLANNAVAQISEYPDGDGFLIRVWPKNGTNEYGGTNLTTISAALKFNDEDRFPSVENLNYDAH